MRIIVGSKNPTKVNAVEAVFPEGPVISLDVSSQVSAQPFSDEETMRGAINRATQCVKSNFGSLGIGLEGGVMYVNDELYLCNWGALVTHDIQIYKASGARIQLPDDIDAQLKAGFELGELMDQYAKRNSVRNHEGAIGIFTHGLVAREEMFTHVTRLLRGQWEFWK